MELHQKVRLNRSQTLRFNIGILHSNQAWERDMYWPMSVLYLWKDWLVMFELHIKLYNITDIDEMHQFSTYV